jgi:4-amino-4-deoxy-L-arabinose transferase-like glycosyltransferase
MRKPIFWLILILALAAVLRFYRLSDYIQFLGDEGRDALVVKAMIVDHKFTLLGPTASVGGFYTGPIYYYFMLPFLWFSNLDPVGPAAMAALFGLATIVLIYLVGRDLISPKAGLIAAVLATFSPQMIHISRFSWNPNPIPFFVLAVIYCLYLAKIKRRVGFTLLAGVCLGVLYQLHYTDLAMIPVGGVLIVWLFWGKGLLKNIVAILGGFLLGDSLFLAFELRHGFPNTKSVLEFLTRRGGAFSGQSLNILWMFYEPMRRTFEVVFGFSGTKLVVAYLSTVAVFIVWLLAQIKNRGKEVSLKIICVWLILGTFILGTYKAFLTDHYFSYLYPLPFLMVGAGSDLLFSHRWTRWLVPVILAVLLYFEISQAYFWKPPNQMIEQTKKIDRLVLEMAGREDFNFALITPGNSDHAYRYFLEVWGRKPVMLDNLVSDPQRKTVVSQLLVVCEQQGCDPEKSSLWEVWGFGKARVVDSRIGPAGINVYKLIH